MDDDNRIQVDRLFIPPSCDGVLVTDDKLLADPKADESTRLRAVPERVETFSQGELTDARLRVAEIDARIASVNGHLAELAEQGQAAFDAAVAS